MLFQIKELILWSKDPSKNPRRIAFEPGKVTVISGASRTGKSAVVPIIDYCLASSSCSIPVNTIRDACEWFGIIVKTNEGEKLLARREPREQRSTDDMFTLHAPEIIEVPGVLVKNDTAPNVKRMLDELAGLTSLDFAAGDVQSSTEGRPSFRDMATMVFQPQNVVANPEVLFFKTDRLQQGEKLKRNFPYILDAITPRLLAMQHELARVQNLLRRKERELREAATISAQWLAELQSHVSQARELGLLERPVATDLSKDEMVELLEGVVNRTDLVVAVSATTVNEAIHELSALNREEAHLSHQLAAARSRLTEMKRIQEGAKGYSDSLRIQRERLDLVQWLKTQQSVAVDCPLCGSHMEPAAEKLAELATALEEVKEASGGDTELPAAFDRELQRVQEEVAMVAEKMNAVRFRQKELNKRSEDAKREQFDSRAAERFVGNLENALKLFRRLGEDGALPETVEDLKARVGELSGALQKENLQDRLKRALDRVNGFIGRLVPQLDCERPDDPVELLIDDLTIRVKGDKRDDYLSEIGSGSNWLSYHVAVLLSLHWYFLSLTHSPVPSFLVLDQPSQVYFPKKTAVRGGEAEKENLTKDLSEDDVEAIRKVFNVLGRMVEAAKGRLQIIVLDHAASDVWGGLDGVVAKEEWRGGQKMIPRDWL